MNCKNCGSQIHFEKGIGICTACGSRFEPTGAYENTEVFIAYVETDAQGRRTADSIVAEELYHKLEVSKIQVFYERISASDLADDDLEQTLYQSFYRSKIVLLVGCEPDNFSAILEEYGNELFDKNILPVYSGMNAYDLPQELQKLQAMNYESIGASADLAQRILTLLGRETELDIVQLANKTQKRRRRILTIGIVAILLALVGTGIFFYYKMLPEKNREESYQQALIAYDEGRYADSLLGFLDHKNYKDAENQILKIFSQYNGYYKTEDGKLDFYLNISNDFNAGVEINLQNVGGTTATIQETVLMNADKIEFTYTDSNRQTGTATIVLENDGIIVKLSAIEKETHFFLADKTDRTIGNTSVPKNLLCDWVKNAKTLKEIEQGGYELVLEETLVFPGYGIAPKFYTSYQYRIQNTDIQLLFGYTERKEPLKHDHLSLTAVCAPATLLLSDKVGQTTDVTFLKEDFIYTARLSSSSFENYSPFVPSYGCWFFDDADIRDEHTWGAKVLTKNDRVILSSKTQLSDELWTDLLCEKEIFDQIKNKDTIKTFFDIHCIEQNGLHYLYTAKFNDYTYCAILNKSDQALIWGAEIRKISNNPNNLPLDLRELYNNKPDVFQEFVTTEHLERWSYGSPQMEFELIIDVETNSSAQTMYVIAEDALNLREEPNTECKVITAIPAKHSVTILSIEDEWAYVQYKEKTGYCSLEYLSAEKPK